MKHLKIPIAISILQHFLKHNNVCKYIVQLDILRLLCHKEMYVGVTSGLRQIQFNLYKYDCLQLQVGFLSTEI
jgi:hypothetical protein